MQKVRTTQTKRFDQQEVGFDKKKQVNNAPTGYPEMPLRVMYVRQNFVFRFFESLEFYARGGYLRTEKQLSPA